MRGLQCGILVQDGRARRRTPMRTARPQRKVESRSRKVPRFLGSLRSAVSDPMSCVCVCYPIVWIAALSPLPPPGSAHGAHSRAYTQSESLSVECENAIALTGLCVVLGGGTIVPPCREAAMKRVVVGARTTKFLSPWLRIWVKRRLRARSCRLSATLHSQGWCSYERRRAHPRCL
jgi:hypothetical protein